jgi:hypothetical protein
MIAEAVLALEYGASSEDIARTTHAHPVTFNNTYFPRLFLKLLKKHVWLFMINLSISKCIRLKIFESILITIPHASNSFPTNFLLQL